MTAAAMISLMAATATEAATAQPSRGSITPSIFSGVTAICGSSPRIERKQALSDLMGENGIELPIIYSEHLTGGGQEMFEDAAKLNFEGIISKNAQAPYRSDRNEGWLKIKTVRRGKFNKVGATSPVIGFVKDPTGVAALYLGKREGKNLVYMGKVGTGWSRTVSSQIRKQLDTVASPKFKLTKPIKEPKAVWVESSFDCGGRIPRSGRSQAHNIS